MNNKRGFTLIELLVVISIIGLLSTLSVLSLRSAQGKARDAKKQSDLKAISDAIEMYAIEEGNYEVANSDCSLDTTVIDNNDNIICSGNKIKTSKGEILFQSLPVFVSKYKAFVGPTGYCLSVLLEDDITIFKCINGSCYEVPGTGVPPSATIYPCTNYLG